MWTRITDVPPPEGIPVETKIDDIRGVRNEQQLAVVKGMWWTPDLSMYVYYTPTHWRWITP